MNGIDIFDGHCDTILACLLHGVGFTRNGGHLDLERAGAYRRYAQFFALYGEPEDFPEPLSFREIFDREYALFRREAEANAGRVSLCTTAAEAETAFAGGRVAAFLSVEGAELLDCSPERLEQAHALGVRSVNVTWNHANALSGTNAEETERGAHAPGPGVCGKGGAAGDAGGRVPFVRRRLLGRGGDPVRPFWASHSNSRKLFSHPRNLTDEQFTAIIEHNGVVGLNLYADFLGEAPGVDTVIAHLDHWMELGGARNIALGGDLDGVRTPAGGIFRGGELAAALRGAFCGATRRRTWFGICFSTI